MNITLFYLPEISISTVSITLRRERPHTAVRQVRRILSEEMFQATQRRISREHDHTVANDQANVYQS